jgi:hypothetical protein
VAGKYSIVAVGTVISIQVIIDERRYVVFVELSIVW